MTLQIKKATKKDSRARVALIGPPGAGKTFTALSLARHMGEKVVLIDSERKSASKYADRFDFDVIELETFSPDTYVEALELIDQSGAYDVVIVDSLSHAWMGKEGALEMVDKIAARDAARQGKNRGDNFSAWREVTPAHNRLVDALLSCRAHLICTMRAKMGYEMTQKNGRTQVEKVGMQAVQREGVEYEFDVVGDMNLDNDLIISKSRCSELQGKIFHRPGRDVAEVLNEWLSGALPPEVDLIEELGRKVYGDDWTDRRAALALHVSQGAVEKIEKLKESEMVRMIRGLEKKLTNTQAPAGEQRSDPPAQSVTAAPAETKQARGRKAASAEPAPSTSGEISATIQYLRDMAAAIEGGSAKSDAQEQGRATYPLRQFETAAKDGKKVALFLMAVYSVANPTELTRGQAIALREWAAASKNGKLVVKAEARAQFRAIVAWWEEQMAPERAQAA